MHLQATRIAACFALSGCHSTEPAYDVAGIPPRFPLSKVARSDRPVFEIDATKDYLIEFGRGSGLDGLDTVAVSSDGTAALHRLTKTRRWATAALTLSHGALGRILKSLKSQRIMFMADAYHADIEDGNQWVLTVTQGNRRKAIYFNNHFPKSILRLAAAIDAELQEAGETALHWKLVPRAHWGDHDTRLWNSIR